MFELNGNEMNLYKVKIIGVGTGGGQVVNALIDLGLRSAYFIAVDTDAQALASSKAQSSIQIGGEAGQGAGAGGSVEVGEQAAAGSREEITKALEGADLVFILTALGGGTGTGAAPIIASCAKELGALTIGIAGLPFTSEGSDSSHRAAQGACLLKQHADTLISISNDRLLSASASEEKPSAPDFTLIADFIYQVINSVLSLIAIPGVINLDLDDMKSVMKNSGTCVVGIGTDHGAAEAARKAVGFAFLGENARKATKVLINVTGAEDNINMFEVNEATTIIQEAVSPSADIIWGASADDKLGDTVNVVLIATGFDSCESTPSQP